MHLGSGLFGLAAVDGSYDLCPGVGSGMDVVEVLPEAEAQRLKIRIEFPAEDMVRSRLGDNVTIESENGAGMNGCEHG